MCATPAASLHPSHARTVWHFVAVAWSSWHVAIVMQDRAVGVRLFISYSIHQVLILAYSFIIAMCGCAPLHTGGGDTKLVCIALAFMLLVAIVCGAVVGPLYGVYMCFLQV